MLRRSKKIAFSCGFVACVTTFFAYITIENERAMKHEATDLYPNFPESDWLACKVPDLDPYDVSIRHLITHGATVNCSGPPPLTYIRKQKLCINQTVLRVYYRNDLESCSYEVIYRQSNLSDNLYSYTPPELFYRDIKVPGEYLRVTCFNTDGSMIYTNFHAAVIRKQDVEERCVHAEKVNKAEDVLNLLILGVDSVSRLNFVRQFNDTRRLLLDELGAFELTGYNKVADNTYVNLVPMFAGKYLEELPWDESKHYDKPFDEYNFIWKDYARNGYRTLYTEDAPHIAIFNYGKEGFHTPPADYYSRPMSLAMEDHGSLWRHERDCAGAKLETERVLDYMKDFMTEFWNDPFYAFGFITRLTHDDINKAGAADKPYYDFFKAAQEEGLLENTVLLFFSDHGIRFGPIRETYVGRMEERLPFMYIAFPEWFYEQYPKIYDRLKNNSRKLTTPFDIYATLTDILNFNYKNISSSKTNNNRGISLLSDIPNTRTCSDASIASHWCTCRPWKVLPPDDKMANHIAKFMIADINKRLRKYRNICAPVRLDSLTDARIIDPGNDRSEDGMPNYNEFMITFRTSPGNALFEVTVETDAQGKRYKLQGDISRINKYDNQGECMSVHSLRKFCFCMPKE